MNPTGTSKEKKTLSLAEQFPPSPPCSCDVCLQYCRRPGWWTVGEADKAIEAGYARRMMLEVAPELTFGVLSPAFKGNEGGVAVQLFASQGCTFLKDDLCELFGTGLQPLECRYCHHSRRGLGEQCHSAIETDWHTKEGQALIIRWGKVTGFFESITGARLEIGSGQLHAGAEEKVSMARRQA